MRARESLFVASLAIAGCGGRVTEDQDQAGDDASVAPEEASVLIDASDDVEAASPIALLDAASCATRPITLSCADGGVKDFLWDTVRKCHPGCIASVHVTLDDEGCPIRVEATGQSGEPLGTCVAPALSTQRWSCGDAGTLDYAFGFGCCTC